MAVEEIRHYVSLDARKNRKKEPPIIGISVYPEIGEARLDYSGCCGEYAEYFITEDKLQELIDMLQAAQVQCLLSQRNKS